LSTHTSADILISIDTIDQLFNGSSINPFSDKTAVILGEAGLPYAIRQELGRGLRSWQGKRLIIRLPPDQIGADLQLQVTNAIRKYAQAKITQNDASIRISRWRSVIGLCLAILIAAALLTFLAMMTQTLLSSASDTVIGIFAGLVTIFIWSTVWNPWDRLVYEWIEPWRENRILRSLTKMEVVVQSELISADHTRPET
jgi:hypothetical protein